METDIHENDKYSVGLPLAFIATIKLIIYSWIIVSLY